MTNAAIKTRTNTSTNSITTRDYAKLSDAALVKRLLVRDDDRAWLEFMSRYSSEVRSQIAKVIAASGRNVFGSDAVDELEADVYLLFLDDNKSMLRHYNPKRSALGSWLCFLAMQEVHRHIRTQLGHGLDESLETFTDSEETSGRGARWISEGL